MRSGNTKRYPWIGAVVWALAAAPAGADQCILDDLIVDGSQCIGFDCVCNGESFGFDTLRLKENNLRIHFDDSSTAAGYPRNDWRIIVNDSAHGGANYFAIEDSIAGDQVFRVEAGARRNALYVESDGDIGIGTSSPSLDVHVRTGDSPSLRLEQDNSSSFAQQVWDVVGNESNFFVRDATHGSALPFRIQPDSPTNAVFIAAPRGDVGVGTGSPAADLHVRRTSGEANLRLQTTAAEANRFELINSGGEWEFIHGSSGAFNLNRVGVAGNQFVFATSGNLTLQGTLFTASGNTCQTGCDRVFEPGFELETIDEHAAFVRGNRHLPAVGPTPEDPAAPIDLPRKTGGILTELEKAHLYIEQLHERVRRLEARLEEED